MKTKSYICFLFDLSPPLYILDATLHQCSVPPVQLGAIKSVFLKHFLIEVIYFL